jgi:hypothetical protein
MPSGGNTPLDEEDWAAVERDYVAARKEGLDREWLRWFIGGLVIDKLPVREASYAACIEWDF